MVGQAAAYWSGLVRAPDPPSIDRGRGRRGAAIVLSGCIGIKPGSYSLTQPAGIGAVDLRLTVCTLVVGELAPESKVPPIERGAPSEPGQGQMLATLVGSRRRVTPESLTAAPDRGPLPRPSPGIPG